MSYHHFDRLEKEYVDSHNSDKVKPLDCVPEHRPKNSWTKGVKAWDKQNGQDVVVGWFHPPRLRNKRKIRYKTKRTSQTHMGRPNKEKRGKIVNPKREWRKMWAEKVNRGQLMDARRRSEGDLDLSDMFSEDDEVIVGTDTSTYEEE